MRNKTLLIVLAILLIVGGWLFITYNGLVKKEENLTRYWADLQTTYQRRNDLVPQLVSVVKASSEYEKNVLAELARARSKAASMQLNTPPAYDSYRQQEVAEDELTGAINRTIAVVEAYPDIKATKNFLYLQSQLEGTERRIRFARKDFNESVAVYNKAVRSFPSSIAASITGFERREGFESSAGAEQRPEVEF